MSKLRNLHIHLGPHKTGSTSIQEFLKDHLPTDLHAANEKLFFNHQIVRKLGKALQEKNWIASHEAISQISRLLVTSKAKTIVISNEDLSGGLVGRNRIRRVYPRLFENVKLLDEALSDNFICKYYFYIRDEDDWLRSVYTQNLKHRLASKNFEDFARSIKGDRKWNSVIRKVKGRLGDRFFALPYPSATSESIVKNFVELVLPDYKVEKSVYDAYWSNIAPDAGTARVLELINRSHASAYAKRKARRFITMAPQGETDQPVSVSTTNVDFLRETDPRATVWPFTISQANTLPDELAPLWKRAETRIHQQEQPNLLPDLTIDFKQARFDLTEGEKSFPGGNRQDMKQQEEILRHRFRGLPLVCFYNAFSISYLRRATPHTSHAKKLFLSLWETEYPILLATLPTRWLISVLQTFMDHGTTEHQRQIGSAGYFFSNTMKAYEAERALEGLAPDKIYEHVEPITPNGFPGLDRFALGNTDLMLNLLALLLEISTRDAVSGRVVQEFLLRTKSAQTLFSRMDQSRIHHNADSRGFENCWSFFEKP